MPYTHLTPHERYCIAHMIHARYSVRLIARRGLVRVRYCLKNQA